MDNKIQTLLAPIVKKTPATDVNLCVICNNPCRPDSTFCSDDCVRKLALNALGSVNKTNPIAAGPSQPLSRVAISQSKVNMFAQKNPQQQQQIFKKDNNTKKSETKIVDILRNKNRVMVFEKKTGRYLAANKAPTVENLSEWLKANPTFDVVKPGSQQALAFQAKQQQLKQLSKTLATTKAVTEPEKKIQTQIQLGNQKQIVLINPQKQQAVSTLTNQSQSQQNQGQQIKVIKQVQKMNVTPKSQPPSQLKQTTLTSSLIIKTPVNQNKILNTTPLSAASPTTPVKASPPMIVNTSKESKPTTSSSSKESKPTSGPTTKDSKPTAPAKKPPESRKQSLDRQSSTSSVSKDSPGTEPIRITVKKTFKDTLTLRMAEVQSGPKLTPDEIEEFANTTELEMFRLFNNDTGVKYKAKYRSLSFNIKDRKNATLFQKICDKSIAPSRLVRMNPDELASNELAKWRENENKHQLEMIKKSELDLLASTKNYVLKTHKGEEVIESKESDRMDIDPTVPVEDVVSLLNNSTVSSTSDSFLSTPVVTKQRLDKFEKMAQENDIKISLNLSTSSPINILNTSSSSTVGTKKKETRRSRSRSRSRGRHESRSSKSSSKHKKHKSRERRSRSRSRSRDRTSTHRSRSRSREKEPKHRENRKEKLERRDAKKDREKEREKDKTKDVAKNIKIIKEPSHTSHTKSIKDIKPKPTEDYNLIDKILEASSSSVQLDEIKAKEKLQAKPVQQVVPIPEQIKKSISIESDQEPSSTVIIPTPPDTYFDSESNEQDEYMEPQDILWSGTIKMIDVASFQILLHAVSGDCEGIIKDLPHILDIVGRISPETVWDYITKIKRSPNKEILILRFACDLDDENSLYVNLYQYLHSRKRLGVIKTDSAFIKDFYVFPLSAQSSLPNVLLPILGPGFVEGDANKPDLLLGIVVRIKGKRSSLPLDVGPSKVNSFELYFRLYYNCTLFSILDKKNFCNEICKISSTTRRTLYSAK